MIQAVNFAIVCNLHQHLLSEDTGTINELANRLSLSRSMLCYTIAYLRDEMGAPIVFDKNKQTYKYKYLPRFFLSNAIRLALSGAMEDRDEHIDVNSEYDMEEDLIESSELNSLFGGHENEDPFKNPIDDDSGGIILDDDIDFNNIFSNYQ
jgi:hypothetical protein